MGTIASHITNLTIVYSTVYAGADQRKHQSSATLAFVQGIYRGPVNSTHKWPVTLKMFPFDDVIMYTVTSRSACNVNVPFKFSCWPGPILKLGPHPFTGNGLSLWPHNRLINAILSLISFSCRTVIEHSPKHSPYHLKPLVILQN